MPGEAMHAVAAASTIARDLLTGMEWTPAQVRDLLRLAGEVKARPARDRNALAGRFLALIFEKPSLRTRVTFEVAAASLGGHCVFLDHTAERLGVREPLVDVAKNLERWVHAIALRTFAQQVLEELAAHAAIPVINALSDRFHPCQALADFFTLEEHFGGLEGLRLAFVGDGNNVCHSLLIAGARLGTHVAVATPPGYAPDAGIVAEARGAANTTRARIELFESPEEAVRGAQAVYTDVWASMGQEHEASVRGKIFAPYRVDQALMARAAPGAVFLHCLPAHRGLEVAADVIDSPRSLIYQQAENRLHTAKAVLLSLLA
jgi:ornithine carbamoyltransferase